jgi:putative endonuclease
MSQKKYARMVGFFAEKVAAEYLMQKGFQLVVQNFRYKRFEIDLIVKKEGLLVFVEVKARKNDLFGTPEKFINQKKINAIRLAATHYISTLENEIPTIRFDIIAILGIGYKDKKMEIMHIEDGFY